MLRVAFAGTFPASLEQPVRRRLTTPCEIIVRDESGVLADPATGDAAKDEVLKQLLTRASPISDVRGSRDYRAAMLLVLSRRLLHTSIERLRAEGEPTAAVLSGLSEADVERTIAYGPIPAMSIAQFIERLVIGHPGRHLPGIRQELAAPSRD